MAEVWGSMRNAIFYLGMGTLFTHELDAVTHHEWRVLPLINFLPEDIALNTFILAHVPLFAIAIAAVASSNTSVRKVAKTLIAGFIVMHGLLHQLFSGHPYYEFYSFTSLFLIFGGALLGAVYLSMEFWPNASNAA